MEPNFWQRKALGELNSAEWEALCDGCGKCCLHKLEDEEDGSVYFTRVSCRYLDTQSCQCSAYTERKQLVEHCLQLKASDVADFHWLPDSCAYRLVAEGKNLPLWHHLRSGSRQTVHEQGMSVGGKAISEEHVHPDGFEEHIVHWV